MTIQVYHIRDGTVGTGIVAHNTSYRRKAIYGKLRADIGDIETVVCI